MGAIDDEESKIKGDSIVIVTSTKTKKAENEENKNTQQITTLI